MTHPVMVLPDAMKALLALSKAAQSGTVPEAPHKLIHLRVSQINGCSVCVDMHVRELKDASENDERTWAVGAWRESPYSSDAECAALALAECVTRLADRPDAVPDAVWDDRRGTPHSARLVQQPSPNRLQLLVEALGDASGRTNPE